MFDAVPIDVPEPYGLARFGEPAGFVLTPAAPRSPVLRYRIPDRRGSERAWLKVRLRATVVTDGDHGTRGFGAVILATEGRASASAEFMPGRRDGRRVVRWSEVALHHSEDHVTRSRRFKIELDNYARTQGTTPGVHTLSFALRLEGGIEVRKVVVHPDSGLELSRQPPQALAISSVVHPAVPRPDEPFTLRYTLRNSGIVPSGPVTLPALLPPSVSPAGPSPRIASVPAHGSRDAELRLRASEPGDYRIQTLARSEVGQALDEIDVHVADRAADSASAAAAGDEGGTGRSAAPLAAAVGLTVASIAAYVVRRRRVRA